MLKVNFSVQLGYYFLENSYVGKHAMEYSIQLCESDKRQILTLIYEEMVQKVAMYGFLAQNVTMQICAIHPF